MGKNTVNEERSKAATDTPVTRGGSWIVRDHEGNYWGPFSSANELGAWAGKKWPDIPEWEEGIEGDCWDVEALNAP
jgi:hypothetical protein